MILVWLLEKGQPHFCVLLNPAALSAGEWGRPVKIRPERLSAEEKAKWDSGWTKHKFNEYISTQISIERDVPDYRPFT